MQCARLIVNHSATHGDGVSQRFIGDSDLFQRMDPARRNGQIDRATADHVPFARISAALVKIDIVSAASQICSEQTTSKPTADENEFRHVYS